MHTNRDILIQKQRYIDTDTSGYLHWYRHTHTQGYKQIYGRIHKQDMIYKSMSLISLDVAETSCLQQSCLSLQPVLLLCVVPRRLLELYAGGGWKANRWGVKDRSQSQALNYRFCLCREARVVIHWFRWRLVCLMVQTTHHWILTERNNHRQLQYSPKIGTALNKL